MAQAGALQGEKPSRQPLNYNPDSLTALADVSVSSVQLQGKGIRYLGEVITLKEGKKGK